MAGGTECSGVDGRERPPHRQDCPSRLSPRAVCSRPPLSMVGPRGRTVRVRSRGCSMTAAEGFIRPRRASRRARRARPRVGAKHSGRNCGDYRRRFLPNASPLWRIHHHRVRSPYDGQHIRPVTQRVAPAAERESGGMAGKSGLAVLPVAPPRPSRSDSSARRTVEPSIPRAGDSPSGAPYRARVAPIRAPAASTSSNACLRERSSPPATPIRATTLPDRNMNR